MTFLKGFIIGIGKIIPGVSGALIAVLLGEYKKMIYSINHIKSNYMYLIKITLGILTSIILFSNVVIFLLKNHYLPTMLFFIGLMSGEIPSFYKKINKKDLLLSILSFSLSLLLFSNNNTMQYNVEPFINKFVLGVIESISTIIPGISGTAIFMMFNVYEIILYYISNIFNFNIICNTIHFLIPYVLGLIITSLLLIKILNTLYTKYESKLNGIIFGFCIYSMLYLLYTTFKCNYNFIEIMVSLILLVLGFSLSKYIVSLE